MDAKASKIIRQLHRAEGYIELHLPERALAELNLIEEGGGFEAAVALLQGEALADQERYTEAMIPLKRAVSMIPAPLNKRAWRSLSTCFRRTGQDALAEIAELAINAESAPIEESPTVVRVAVVPLSMLSEAVERLMAQINHGHEEPPAIE
jgi:tetratricopeptide (TPR) repeat protein